MLLEMFITINIVEEIILDVDKKELKQEVLPLLEDNIFHVTTEAGFQKIKKCGAIFPSNTKGVTREWNASKTSFFGTRNCVSVCDLVSNQKDKWLEALYKYYFLQPNSDKNPVFLIFKKDILSKLISWEQWKKEKIYEQQVVPFLEAGHAGNISISMIEKSIIVKVDNSYDIEDAVSLAIKRASSRRRLKEQRHYLHHNKQSHPHNRQ